MGHAVGDVNLAESGIREGIAQNSSNSGRQQDGTEPGEFVEHVTADDVVLSDVILIVGFAALDNPGFGQVD